MSRGQQFIRSGILLTLTALATRSVGMLFSVYLSDKLGETGLGIYALVLSVYSLAITFSAAGIHLTTTKLVAEALGAKNPAGARAVARRAILLAAGAGTVAGLLLFFFAPAVGTRILGDARTVPSLQVLAFGLPFLAVGNAIHGYFNGVRRVAHSAATHLFEQMLRIGLTALFLARFLPRGIAYACLAVVLGTMLSEVAACALGYLAFLQDKQKLGEGGTPPKRLFRRIAAMVLPLSLSACLRSGLTTIEHIAIPRGLKKQGADADAAMANYGALSGMAFPLLLYPQALVGSFAGLLVPEVAEAQSAGKNRTVARISTLSLRFTFYFAVGVGGLFFALADLFGGALYHSETAVFYIRVFAPLVPVMYLDGVTDGLLKGLGEHLYTMRVNILDAALSVSMVLLLLPRFGVTGYVWTVWVCEVVNFALSLFRLYQIRPPALKLYRDLVAPCIATVCATALTYIIARLLPRTDLPTLLFASLLYLLFLLLSFQNATRTCRCRRQCPIVSKWRATLFRVSTILPIVRNNSEHAEREVRGAGRKK